MFAAFNAGVALFGERATLHFIRVMGSALSQVAEAAIALFGANVERPLTEQHAPAEVRFKSGVLATQALAASAPVSTPCFASTPKPRSAASAGREKGVDSFESARLVVGFVDLVGFTPLAERVDPRELSALFDDFEDLAFDVITAHDARLVKLIGDTIMFTAFDADDSVRHRAHARRAVLRRFEPGDARGALASGEMLVRGGDYYGPVVNLAARAADLAVPYEVLVSESVAAETGANSAWSPPGAGC